MPLIPNEVLALLACPVCRDVLTLDTLAVCCRGCGRRYPIVDGIPVLVPERAQGGS